MASLYVIRHGRTDWNEIKRIQGSTDTSINEEGRQMAREAHDRYADVHFDICFCSPMKRARETAAPTRYVTVRDANGSIFSGTSFAQI